MKKSHPNLTIACALAVVTLLALAVSALGLPAAAGDIPPDLTPVSYLPYLVLQGPARLRPRSYLPYVVANPTPTPTSTPTPTATPTPTPAPPPGPVGLKVYDMYGAERTYQWAVNKYGVRVEQIGGWAYHCVELREISGPASLEVWVYRADGLPKPNVRVEFHWPTGMDVRYTEDTGKAGFGYGPGSWIFDPEVGGPHWLVIENTSSCDAVSRLGMLAGTVHDHLDVSYRYGRLSAAP
jgi:hypothetical protein